MTLQPANTFGATVGAIELDDLRPMLRLEDVGNTAKIAVTGLDPRQARDYETRAPRVNPKTGNPVIHYFLAGLLIEASGGLIVETPDEEITIRLTNPGDHFRPLARAIREAEAAAGLTPDPKSPVAVGCPDIVEITKTGERRWKPDAPATPVYAFRVTKVAGLADADEALRALSDDEAERCLAAFSIYAEREQRLAETERRQAADRETRQAAEAKLDAETAAAADAWLRRWTEPRPAAGLGDGLDRAQLAGAMRRPGTAGLPPTVSVAAAVEAADRLYPDKPGVNTWAAKLLDTPAEPVEPVAPEDPAETPSDPAGGLAAAEWVAAHTRPSGKHLTVAAVKRRMGAGAPETRPADGIDLAAVTRALNDAYGPIDPSDRWLGCSMIPLADVGKPAAPTAAETDDETDDSDLPPFD